MKFCFTVLCFFNCLLFAQVSEARRVLFEITKFRNLQKITPDTITLNERSINPLGDTVAPGKYRLVIAKHDYATIDKHITIPHGKGLYVIKETMIARGLTGFHIIRGDFAGEMRVDTFLLNGKKCDVTHCIPQGVHQLLIEKNGYHKIEREITVVNPGFYLFEELQSKMRSLEIDFVSSYTNKKINPQHVSVNGIPLNQSQLLKPGHHLLVIEHNGYQRIRKPIVVQPSEQAFALTIKLHPAPRKVVYQFTDNNKQVIVPDSITMNGQKVRFGQRHLPCNYTVVVTKDGYQTKRININIKPDNTDYQIQDSLSVLTRKIKLHITGDFPVDEMVEPEMITLNGKTAYGNEFVPGKYTLHIEQPGYVPFVKEIVIAPSHKPFLIKEVLTTQPRKVKIHISYDIDPSTQLFVRNIKIAPLHNISQEREVRSGDFIKPGSYKLTIKQYGYDTIEVKQHVWPDEREYVIDQQLRAKSIPLLCIIAHDVPPPSDLPPYQVSIISKNTKVLFLTDGPPQIRAGAYYIKITQPGYHSVKQEVYIPPSEEVFFITGHLKAHKRKIAFTMKDLSGQEATIYQLQNLKNQKLISEKDEFQPGEELQLRAKFMNYPTVKFTMKIVPGVKPQILPLHLVRLRSLHFSISKNQFYIDDLQYHFDFTIDGKTVEQHHIQVHKKEKYNYQIMMPANSKKIRFYQGYLFAEKPIASVKNRWILPRMNEICISRLIDHLRKVKQQSSEEKYLNILQTLVTKSSLRGMIKKCAIVDRQKLINYLEENTNEESVKKIVDVLCK